jgi:heptosyltransferase III
MKKAVIFACAGLGDGLIFLTLAKNLVENGYQVTFYHNFLQDLQNLIDFDVDILSYNKIDDIEKVLSENDKIFINLDSSPIHKKIKNLSEIKFSHKFFIFKPSTHKGKKDHFEKYVSRNVPIAKSLEDFCKNVLKLPKTTIDNGIIDLKLKKENRVVIHPTSSKISRNYPFEKFLKIAKKIKKLGYDVSFVMKKEEIIDFKKLENYGIEVPLFNSLEQMARYIASSKYFIGNDSGVGFLASSLKLPTVTIFSTKRKKDLWLPAWGKAYRLYPLNILPNFKGLRLKNKYWKKLIFTKKVFKLFKTMEKQNPL